MVILTLLGIGAAGAVIGNLIWAGGKLVYRKIAGKPDDKS